MIELSDLSFTFNRGTVNETQAVSNINLCVPTGEFLILVGSNGSGKSTLVNLISGTCITDQGKIILDGSDISKLEEHKRCRWISRVFQNPLLGTAPDLSILENFRLASLRTKTKGLKIGTGNQFRSTVKSHLADFELGLESKLDQLVGSLSGGQRQALTLSMAVMDEAKVLLMDEPASALDPKTAEIFMKLADKVIHERKLTAILITHRLNDALQYGNRLIQLKNGMILRDIQGNKKSTINQNELFSWFGD